MSKIGFWQLYRQAMIGGKNGEWYMLCSQAARQGVTRNKVELAVSMAWLTQITLLPWVIWITCIILWETLAWKFR